MSDRLLSAVINLITLILFALNSPAAWGPEIVLSMLYANSMMVFLNNRILSGLHGSGDQEESLEMVTEPFGSVRFTTASGPADAAQELALDGHDNTRSSTSGRTVAEDSSKKHSHPL